MPAAQVMVAHKGEAIVRLCGVSELSLVLPAPSLAAA